MANVIIFSDGTGQRGGLLFDERRSNIYKLFRATRCGPDSTVDPSQQLAFYDPGLGTVPAGQNLGFIGALWRFLYNLASQATGLGITRNIVDCYAAIIRLWRPGDHIFLFGFSRGAYTVRCLSAVLGMCGVPTHDAIGQPLRRDEKTTGQIASEGVRKVYQHTESQKTFATPRQQELAAQRQEMARRFREKYGASAADNHKHANAYPHFVGVFDTVAALANPRSVAVFAGIGILPLLLLAAAVARFFPHALLAFGTFVIVAVVVCSLLLVKSLVRSEWGLPRANKWHLFHFTEVHMEKYETDLSPEVAHARHAISIDEHRKTFARVPWGGSDSDKKKVPGWFEQQWFAGNHSDVGGSYPENESRLSDISLAWMLDAAVKAGLIYDPSVLHLYPAANGPQHDETKASFIFGVAAKLKRPVDKDAPLHPSVLERFAAAEVLQYDKMAPYRPENLREHTQVKHFYNG